MTPPRTEALSRSRLDRPFALTAVDPVGTVPAATGSGGSGSGGSGSGGSGSGGSGSGGSGSGGSGSGGSGSGGSGAGGGAAVPAVGGSFGDDEPIDDVRRRRADWRDTVRVATDVALLGILTTVVALPLVTAGAAVATASAATHHFLEHEGWPSAAQLWAVFRRALLPGLVAALGAVAVVVLLALDLTALRRGLVPGGAPLTVLTVVLAALGVGYAGIVVVKLGARPGRGLPAAVRAAASVAVARPVAVPAATGVVALAGLLGALVHPALVPVLVGYALFALHAVARRQRW